MPEIGLANDVSIEFDADDVNTRTDYEFTESVPQLGDFAVSGTLFELYSRSEEHSQTVFKFETESGVNFQLAEQTFQQYITDGVIIKLSD